MTSTIERRTRVVFFSPKAGRHYFTRKAAVYAEARAMMLAKYPSERRDVHGINWHWTEDERLCRVYTRLSRSIHRASLIVKEKAGE